MISIRIDTSPAEKRLRSIGARLKQERLLRAIGVKMLDWIHRSFEAEGLEVKWRPLSPNTLASRSGGGKMLRVTGRLKRSFGMKVSGNTVEIGSPLDLAGWQHSGTKSYAIRPRSARALRFMSQSGAKFAKYVKHPGLPARPLIPSERLARRIAIDVVADEINRAVKGYGTSNV